MPRANDRYTVACTVSNAVQGAKNGIGESSTCTETHQAAVAATVDLTICIASVMTYGERSSLICSPLVSRPKALQPVGERGVGHAASWPLWSSRTRTRMSGNQTCLEAG